MVASLYPEPLDVDETLELTGLGGDRPVSAPEALRWADPARALRRRARQQPRAADARRADRRDGRRGSPRLLGTMREHAARGKTILFATHYLEEADAYADRAVLMAHGRVVADGPDHRDQGDGRLAHDPRHAAPRRARRAGSGSPASAAPSAAAKPSCSAARTPTPRSARCSPRTPTARDIEIAAAGLEQAFLQLTGRLRRRRRRPGARRARGRRAERASRTPASSCCAPCATAASSSSRSGFRWSCSS